MRHIEMDGFTRINKTAARKLFESGAKIFLAPCNMPPVSMWGQAAECSKDRCDCTFESLVNSFEYYNCNYSETGRYTAFYIKQ